MSVVDRRPGRYRRLEQTLWQNDAGTQSLAIAAVAALANTIEAVTRCHNPAVGRRPVQVFTKILEYCRILRRNGSKVVEGLIHSRREACGGYIVPEYATINHLREKSRPRGEFRQQVGDVLLPLWHECLFVARPAPKGDDHYFSRSRNCERRLRSHAEQS